MLFVSDERAWPLRSGYRRRTAQILRSLAMVAPVTWVAAPRNRHGDDGPLIVPDELRAAIEPVLVAAPTRGRLATLTRWVRGRLPWPLAAGDWTAVETELRGRNADRFDLLWAMGVDALHAAQRAGIDAAVTIVDADLESLKLRRQLDWEQRGIVRRVMGRIDAGRWERLEQRAAADVTTFSLCSDLEREVFGHDAWVTPNSFRRPQARPARAREQGSMLFVGSLGYAPNLDALTFFVDEVLPTIRATRPEARLRVVGAGLAAGHRLSDAPGVDVIGFVDDTGPELAAAQLVVVPLRWGAGTRIKILEAFANRVPVVSTTLGAEGLDVAHDRELLLADGPEALAAACLSAMADENLRRRLVNAAHERFEERYEERIVTEQLIARVRRRLAMAE